jgi:hypothetical protein
MDKHVRVVGWLWIVWGVVSMLMALGGLPIINSQIPGSEESLLVVSGTLCVSIPGFIAALAAGFGLLKYKGWARILAIILAVVNIVFLCALIVPLALGIYTLIIMFNQKTKALFTGEGAPVEIGEAG